MFRLNFQYSISQNWRRFLTEFSRLERCKGMLSIFAVHWCSSALPHPCSWGLARVDSVFGFRFFLQLLPLSILFVRFRLGLLEWVFPGFSHTTIPVVQRNANLVDLEKCSKMSIWLQRLASMTSITSLSKFGGWFNSIFNPVLRYEGTAERDTSFSKLGGDSIQYSILSVMGIQD